MNIALARVDSRLIHGQIVESWVPATKATVILVANDAVARDAWRASIMKACVPEEIRVLVSRVEDVAAGLEKVKEDHQTCILLFATVPDAVQSYAAGVKYHHLNLGNVHEQPGARQVSPTVFLSTGDEAALRELQAGGVAIEIRAVSRDRPLPATLFLR